MYCTVIICKGISFKLMLAWKHKILVSITPIPHNNNLTIWKQVQTLRYVRFYDSTKICSWKLTLQKW